jgi:hypothetical protein
MRDHVRPGRLITEATTENIEHVHSLINDDPRVTKEKIQVQSAREENVEKQDIRRKTSKECDRIHRCPRMKKEDIEMILEKILFKSEAISIS